MATYAKILKDNAGNQILPYTRSKLVYMNDGSTVEDAINNIQNQGGYTLPAATQYTLGGVKIGNNIYNDNGTISIRKSQVCNALGYQPLSHRGGTCPVTSDDIIDALGYTPSNKSYTISSFNADEMSTFNNNYTYKNGVTIYHAGGGARYISACLNHVYTGDNFALVQFYITTSRDWVAGDTTISLRVRWENRIVDTSFGRIIVPIYMMGNNLFTMQEAGSILLNGGYENELSPTLLATTTIPSGYSIFSNFIYPLK